MDVGAAEFTVLNLGNLNTSVIEINAGIGHIELGFTGDWRQNARVSVDMGLGCDTYYSLDYDEAEYQITVDVDAAFGSIRVAWVD